MNEILECINQSAAGVTALATIAIAVLTFVLARENKMLREAGMEPKVAAYLIPHPDGNGGVNFVLANIGQGPAINVKFSLEYDEADFNSHNALLHNDADRTALTVLPQGEKISSLFGIGYVLFGEKEKDGSGAPLKPFTVRITYSDLKGHIRTSQHEIDIRQFRGLAGIANKPTDREIADSMKKIETHLGAISKQVGPFIDLIDATALNNSFRQKLKGRSPPQEDEEKSGE